MSRRMRFFPALLACTLLAPIAAFGQAAPGLKIGAVSFARLMQDSPQAKITQKALEDEFSPRQRELLAKQNELKERQAKLDKDSAVMGAEERRNAESKYRDDERDFGRRMNAFQEDINARRNEEVNKLQRELMQEVQAFAKQKGYDLIVGEGVLYAAPNVDLTSQILANVEATFKSKAPGKP